MALKSGSLDQFKQVITTAYPSSGLVTVSTPLKDQNNAAEILVNPSLGWSIIP